MKIGDTVKLIKPRNSYNQYVVERLMNVRGQERTIISSTAYPNFASMTRMNVRLEDIVLVDEKDIILIKSQGRRYPSSKRG